MNISPDTLFLDDLEIGEIYSIHLKHNYESIPYPVFDVRFGWHTIENIVCQFVNIRHHPSFDKPAFGYRSGKYQITIEAKSWDFKVIMPVENYAHSQLMYNVGDKLSISNFPYVGYNSNLYSFYFNKL